MSSINIKQGVIAISALSLFIYTFIVGINSFFRYNDFRQEFELKITQLSRLKQRQKHISKLLVRLNNSNEWEKIARRRLNLTKTNETIYQFYHKEPNE